MKIIENGEEVLQVRNEDEESVIKRTHKSRQIISQYQTLTLRS